MEMHHDNKQFIVHKYILNFVQITKFVIVSVSLSYKGMDINIAISNKQVKFWNCLLHIDLTWK